MKKRIAAVITALTVFMCCLGGCSYPKEDDGKSIGVELLNNWWTVGMSSKAGIEISFKDDDSYTYLVKADGGVLRVVENNDTRFVTDHTFNAGETACWDSFYVEDDGENYVEMWHGDMAYVDIIAKNGDDAVGYAIVKITLDDPESQSWNAELIKQERFEKGPFSSKVTEEYVRKRIEEVTGNSAE